MFIRWSNGEETVVPYVELRFHCRCAVCIDEWTRERRMTREQVRQDIRPLHVESVGRYAVKIDWNDGHRTGIYTFELLYAIAKGTADQVDKVKDAVRPAAQK